MKTRGAAAILAPLAIGLPLAVGAAQAAAPDARTLAAVDRLIRARAEADSFSGAVLIARAGVPILRAGYGLADRDKRAMVTPETKFNLGSIDKLITRIALWQLVAAGKLQLDAPIGTYLPDYWRLHHPRQADRAPYGQELLRLRARAHHRAGAHGKHPALLHR